jgi:uncharacterized protein (TIGR02145 family)/prepilin-type N-terminal cleavage/methylation domain-containing protein
MTLKTNKSKPKTNQLGFTIVELLVVIVVIGILAAITIVSYTGITAKANESSIKSELANASKKLSMYYAQYESYPTTSGLNLTTGCPTLPNDDTNYCIKFNSGTTVTYKSDNSNSYNLTFTKNNLTFTVSQSGTIAAGTPAPAEPTLPESDWITIGTQRWARKNLNVGTMITGLTTQANNATIEKYCYNNDEANCSAYGGLYQWNEAMNWTTTEGSRGICPSGSRIPSDNDWKVLEMQLGMTQSEADAEQRFRGTDQAIQLRDGGGSGMNVLLAGNANLFGAFDHLDNIGLTYVDTWYWSSSEYTTNTTNVWTRSLDKSRTDVLRAVYEKAYGFSVRCLGS